MQIPYKYNHKMMGFPFRGKKIGISLQVPNSFIQHTLYG